MKLIIDGCELNPGDLVLIKTWRQTEELAIVLKQNKSNVLPITALYRGSARTYYADERYEIVARFESCL